jgi:hypothetical protein
MSATSRIASTIKGIPWTTIFYAPLQYIQVTTSCGEYTCNMYHYPMDSHAFDTIAVPPSDHFLLRQHTYFCARDSTPLQYIQVSTLGGKITRFAVPWTIGSS